MEENKNLNPQTENEAEETLENVDSATQAGEKKTKKAKNRKPRKKLLKNQALFKKGGFSIALTAIVIIAAIVINVLVSALSERFVLEIDLTTDKINTVNEENIKYLKNNVKDDITVIVCADEDTYASYMNSYAQNYYGIADGSDYYNQTVNLIKKYNAYNKKIDIQFVDMYSTEFTAISKEYANSSLAYGDIIVSCEKNGNKRHKILSFTDVYSLTEDNTYASYYGTTYTMSGNNLETALTSAIAYVTSAETKTIGIITGHSTADYTSDFREILKLNNFEIVDINDSIVTTIPEEVDALVIAAPNKDFIQTELDTIAAFLDNDGNLSKGLVFFADATAPYLTNLYDFLSQWGIEIDDGILFETNTGNHTPDDPFTMGLYPSGADEITNEVQGCITGYNVPITAAFESKDGIKVTSLIDSMDTVVAAPKGTDAGWTGHSDYEAQKYSGILQAVKESYNDDNEFITSYVMALSSVEFIYSEYNQYTKVLNTDVAYAVTDRAAGTQNTGISFSPSRISNESFSAEVTEASANVMRAIFMWILPALCLVVAVIVFIKRRNS